MSSRSPKKSPKTSPKSPKKSPKTKSPKKSPKSPSKNRFDRLFGYLMGSGAIVIPDKLNLKEGNALYAVSKNMSSAVSKHEDRLIKDTYYVYKTNTGKESMNVWRDAHKISSDRTSIFVNKDGTIKEDDVIRECVDMALERTYSEDDDKYVVFKKFVRAYQFEFDVKSIPGYVYETYYVCKNQELNFKDLELLGLFRYNKGYYKDRF